MVMVGKTWKDSAREDGFKRKKHVPYKREKRDKMRKLVDEDLIAPWYAVFQRHGKWWFTDVDDQLRREHGPFDTELEAHTGAVHYAQHDGV